ncbi:MAG: ferritin-like domain-containing protein [bacterium]
MASKELLDKMNDGIARELQVAIQYMWQHVLWHGCCGFITKDMFRSTAITEMKHAEAIAERLTYLGGTPTTKPTNINVGKEVKDMLEQDIKDEEGAIKLYKEIIALSDKEGDITTRKLFESILADEEDHHDTFTSLLEGM